MKVLAVGCHPDDVETSCAGTLAQYYKQGDQVTICHVANGDKGHMEIEPEELSKIRKEEARSAGTLIAADVISLDIGDLEIEGEDKHVKDLLVDVIRDTTPDVIITHAPDDYMPDHVAVSKQVFAASFAASVPHYRTSGKNLAAITPIYYMDTLAGVGFNPTYYVDISDSMETKLNMLKKHRSQLKWMKEHDKIDFVDFVKTVAKFRGLQCGVDYAEGFRQSEVWPRLKAERLLP